MYLSDAEIRVVVARIERTLGASGRLCIAPRLLHRGGVDTRFQTITVDVRDGLMHIGERRGGYDSAEFAAVDALPAGVDVHVLVAVVRQSRFHEPVRDMRDLFMGDKLPHRVPARPAEQRGETACIRRDHEPNGFGIRAKRVFRVDLQRIFSVSGDLAGENAAFRVQCQPVRQIVDGKSDRARASGRNPPEERLAGGGAIDAGRVDFRAARARIGCVCDFCVHGHILSACI